MIPDSAVKIIGIGGAGANMLDRAAMDGMEGAELLSLNSDLRNLAQSVAGEKLQLGKKLTRGLGAGGDPEVGLKAAQEVELEIRDSLRDREIVFICVGLGGGTGSGAAPLVTRIAREMGAFVAVFATMPFHFEGKRRKDQAESSLNELSVLANALVTFDNGRMGELVLAKAGIHDAFAAADRMISDSIRAVTRIVTRPGLINMGLDDVMSALSSHKSRCLFGSGLAHGENRSQQALSNALNSPLLDKGALLKKTGTALVHICGGEDMTLYEVELLMRDLSKHVTESAHILFGAATDETMGDSMSVTIISSLPEDVLVSASEGGAASVSVSVSASTSTSVSGEAEEIVPAKEEALVTSERLVVPLTVSSDSVDEVIVKDDQDDEVENTIDAPEEDSSEEADLAELVSDEAEIPSDEPSKESSRQSESVMDSLISVFSKESSTREKEEPVVESEGPESGESEDLAEQNDDESSKGDAESDVSGLDEDQDLATTSQGELSLDGGPRGRFEGEAPNLIDGEDLDVPPFMRKR